MFPVIYCHPVLAMSDQKITISDEDLLAPQAPQSPQAPQAPQNRSEQIVISVDDLAQSPPASVLNIPSPPPVAPPPIAPPTQPVVIQPYPTVTAPPRRRKWPFIAVGALVMVLLLGGVLFLQPKTSPVSLPPRVTGNGGNSGETGTNPNTGTTKKLTIGNQIAQDADKCVVIIQAYFQETVLFFFNAPAGGTGSGTIIAQDNEQMLILTNRHVVSNSKGEIVDELTVRSHSGQSVSAKVVAIPANRNIDLALLTAPRIPDMQPMWKIGYYDQLSPGDRFLAVGHPLEMDFTLTDGICSAKREGLIQHTAPINPGNSGGPLLDEERTLIGVNTFLIQDAQGLFFAFPADLVLDKSLWEYKMDINALLSKIQTTKTKTN